MKTILLPSFFIISLSLCSFGQQPAALSNASASKPLTSAQGLSPKQALNYASQPSQLSTQSAQPSAQPQQSATQPATPPADKPSGISPVQMPKTVKFAQPFTLTYSLPSAGKLLAEPQKDFTLIGSKEDKANPNLIAVDIMPFNLGVSTLTAITFELMDGSKIKTAPLEIDIQSSDIKTKAQGLIDIRSPYRPFNWSALIWIIIGVIIVAAIALYLSRKKTPVSQEAGPYGGDLRPFYIIALERIDNLDASDLWQNGLYKDFYIQLIDIFRDYLSARFSVDAHSCTSRELERRLLKKFSSDKLDFLFRKEGPAPADFKELLPKIKELNSSADLVKFAKQQPSLEAKTRDVAAVKEVILFTKQEEPLPLAASAKQASSSKGKNSASAKKDDDYSSGGLP